MSIALFNAISGLNNFQRVLDTVGNNIANISTPGYKKTRVNFQEMLSQTLRGATLASETSGGTNPVQLGLGSKIASIDSEYSQGVLETTGRATDLAITGNGFFIVKSDRGIGYTRNGNFYVDTLGSLTDANGNLVQGWLADNLGNVNPSGPLEGIKIPIGEAAIARATSEAIFVGNLDASQGVYTPAVPPVPYDPGDPLAIPPIPETPAQPGIPESGGRYISESIVYDSLGVSHTFTLDIRKTADNEWTWTSFVNGDPTTGPNNTGVFVFNENGLYDMGNSIPAIPLIDFPVGGGAAPLSFTLDLSTSTQLSTPGQYSFGMKAQNGFQAGTLNSFAIDRNGNVIGGFSNGMSQLIGVVALADFSNPQGLEKTDGGILIQTSNSGFPQVGPPNSGPRGAVNGGALEMSNVDLSSEFTKMIIAQRAFQANSRMVSVMDSVLEEVANLKR
jgi:flagellar hook protein FlgE